MKYHDISVAISPLMPVYEGDEPADVKPISSISRGDRFNILQLRISTHTGTHIDAPLHIIDKGKNVLEIPLEILHGPALVIDVGDANVITPDVIGAAHLEIKRILFKTRNSSYWSESRFHKDYVYLSAEAAKMLVSYGVKLVGIDYLSIAEFGPKAHETHLALLRADVVALEGLNLSQVSAGMYDLICLPLPISSGDGAPCRAILLEK